MVDVSPETCVSRQGLEAPDGMVDVPAVQVVRGDIAFVRVAEPARRVVGGQADRAPTI